MKPPHVPLKKLDALILALFLPISEVHRLGLSTASEARAFTHIARNRFFSLSKSNVSPFFTTCFAVFASAEFFSSERMVHNQSGYSSSALATGSAWPLRTDKPVRTVPGAQEDSATDQPDFINRLFAVRRG